MNCTLARPRVVSVLEAIEACPERFFGTLTTRRRLDPSRLSNSFGEWDHRMNRLLFGMAYARRGMRTAIYPVQELHANQGWHTHFLMGLLDGSRAMKANPPCLPLPELAIQTWCALDLGRDPLAQNIQPVTDFAGAVEYIHKTIRGRDAVDRIDVPNLHIPNVA